MRNSRGNAKEEAEEEEKKKKEMIQVSRTEIPWGDISMEDLGRSKEKKEKAQRGNAESWLQALHHL